MPCPFRSSQGHSAAWPSRDILWATCPRSSSSGYHAEFNEDCYQKHTNPPSQRSIPTTVRSGSSTLQKKDLLNCWTSSSDISGYQADFHEGHSTVGRGQRQSMAWARHATCESAFTVLWLLCFPLRSRPVEWFYLPSKGQLSDTEHGAKSHPN